MVSRVRRDRSSIASKVPPLCGTWMPESEEEDSDSPADCFESRRPLENFLREGLKRGNFFLQCDRCSRITVHVRWTKDKLENFQPLTLQHCRTAF